MMLKFDKKRTIQQEIDRLLDPNVPISELMIDSDLVNRLLKHEEEMTDYHNQEEN